MPITYGLPLFLKAAMSLGEKLWEWEPETLAEVFPNPVDLEKALALANFVVNDSAHDQWEVFLNTVLVLNDRPASFDYIPDVTVSELCWAVAQLGAIDPVLTFSTEVLKLIAVVLHEEGWVNPPKWLAPLTSIEGISLGFLLSELNTENGEPGADAAKSALVKIYMDSHRQDLESYMKTLEQGMV